MQGSESDIMSPAFLWHPPYDFDIDPPNMESKEESIGYGYII